MPRALFLRRSTRKCLHPERITFALFVRARGDSAPMRSAIGCDCVQPPRVSCLHQVAASARPSHWAGSE
eukprot:7912689-Lingulodinium_polyedra.AAC.1